MSRATIAVDRLVTFILALALLASGAGAAVWGTDRVSPLSGSLHFAPVAEATTKTWWPWAAGAGGVVLVLLGLRWLLSHLPRRGIGPVKLTGTGRGGRLEADAGSAATAAAQVFEATPGVRSAHGTMMHERGHILARLNVTIEPHADLTQISEAADRISAQLRHVLGRDDLTCRIQLRVGGRNKPAPRVQ
jgi:hypothetical protein